MTPSERINVKKAILREWRETSPREMQLVLHEFITDPHMQIDWGRFEGDDESYVIASLRYASDEVLHGIAAHLGAGVDPAGPPTEGLPGFWTPGHFRLFITHVNADRERAGLLREKLAPFYISAFVAHDDIEVTAEWQREIESALRTMDALTAIIGTTFKDSRWTDQEVGIALGRSKLVVPLRYGADPHGFIGKNQALTIAVGKTSAETIAGELNEVLRRHPLTKERMLDALVLRFEESHSWNDARSNLKMLEAAESLTPEMLRRIRAAYDKNDEVKNAGMVPARINALLQKHAFKGPLIDEDEDETDPPF